MKIYCLFISIMMFILFIIGSPAVKAQETAEETSASTDTQEGPSIFERRMDIINFGTETEIASLIQTLRSERDFSLDDVLIGVAQTSRNRNIMTGIFSFFGERAEKGLETRAIRIINERDTEVNEVVFSAIDYLGWVNAVQGVDVLIEMLNSGETRFLNNVIRAMGRAAKGDNAAADRVAELLLKYYDDANPSNESQREIIISLGEAGSSLPVSFLSEIIRNPDERFGLKMVALEALGKIADPSGLDAIIEAVSATDPNVRASAIAALGPFSGEEVDTAILDGFRDSFVRTRIGAAQAAGSRKLEAAVPFLRFRAENDENVQVRDEAIKALGAIWSSESIVVLESIFQNRRGSDRLRILSGEMLLENNALEYTGRVIVELEEARTSNQTALYNGFLRILGPIISPDLETLASRFLANGSVIEKLYALDMAANNNFTSLEEAIRSCLDERRNGAAIARRAETTLEKLGL